MTTDRRVLVGFDGSKGAQAALRWALTSPGARSSSVEAVAAWRAPVAAVPPWMPTPPFDEESLTASFLERMADEIDHVRSFVPDCPPVPLHAISGPAGPVLADAAAGAHMLVVGRRGHGGFAGLLLGSVADYCLQHAGTPVAIVPHAWPEPQGAVVAAIDGSERSLPVLEWSVAEADRRGTKVVALYAWSWLDQPGSFDPGFDADAAREFAEGVVTTCVGDQCSDIQIVNDLPARALMERSGSGELVVVGNRPHWALGSVSRQLAHHAPSPVVVVRAPA